MQTKRLPYLDFNHPPQPVAPDCHPFKALQDLNPIHTCLTVAFHLSAEFWTRVAAGQLQVPSLAINDQIHWPSKFSAKWLASFSGRQVLN